MMKGGHGQTNQLHDINWGALDHASHAPQLMSCSHYVYTLPRHVHEKEATLTCIGMHSQTPHACTCIKCTLYYAHVLINIHVLYMYVQYDVKNLQHHSNRLISPLCLPSKLSRGSMISTTQTRLP